MDIKHQMVDMTGIDRMKYAYYLADTITPFKDNQVYLSHDPYKTVCSVYSKDQILKVRIQLTPLGELTVESNE
jgi:hypothetical protein